MLTHPIVAAQRSEVSLASWCVTLECDLLPLENNVGQPVIMMHLRCPTVTLSVERGRRRAFVFAPIIQVAIAGHQRTLYYKADIFFPEKITNSGAIPAFHPSFLNSNTNLVGNITAAHIVGAALQSGNSEAIVLNFIERKIHPRSQILYSVSASAPASYCYVGVLPVHACL